ncbi:phage holin family protein [Kocuria rhizophila]|nr:phage holin family protein [Kocuria rhizophila]
MSHAVGPNSGHSPRAGTRTTKKPGASIVDARQGLPQAAAQQLKDEAQLAVLELKAKGIKLGIGAAFAVVGLIFLGLARDRPWWERPSPGSRSDARAAGGAAARRGVPGGAWPSSP